jgi:DNA-binding HxlR family transcriptional regulator
VQTEPSEEVTASACGVGGAALAHAFALLGKRWTAQVLGSLESAPAGFRELARSVEGISDSVLSDRLSELAANGLVVRTVAGGPPVTVSYELTDHGRALIPALGQIARWAVEHLPH